MIQAAPAPAHDLYGMGQDLCRRLAPSPAPSPPQGKRASLRRRRSVGSAPANGIDAVKWTASIAFGSCTCSETVTTAVDGTVTPVHQAWAEGPNPFCRL